MRCIAIPKNKKHPPDEIGSVKIANEVIAIIAGLAATEVEGVAGLGRGSAGGLAEIVGRKNVSEGVKVTLEGTQALIELSIVIVYGAKIPDVTRKVKAQVKKTVEATTGLEPSKIHVHVVGVDLAPEAAYKDED